MTAEILSVGTELLLGTIVNTNAAFLSEALAKLGIAVYSQATVGDNHDRLMLQLQQSFGKADMLIVSGGLGPTQDDITKSVAAEYFGQALVMHEESLNRIKARFAGRELPDNVERNALVLENAEILLNDNGAAPGIIIEKDGKTLIMLPGPPHEMEPMFTTYATAFLRKKTDRVFLSRTIKIIGIGESKVETMLQDLIDAQTNPTIAPYAKVGEVHVRVTASAPDEQAAKDLIHPLVTEICNRLTPHVYNESVILPQEKESELNEESTLAEIVINLIKSQHNTLAIAESCTGGLLTADLVAIPGCSAILYEGLATYANISKIRRLGVSEDIIMTHGAVSRETAGAMAEGIAKTSGATIGISTTGIAGPDGGTPEKPVGLVYIGIHMDGKTETHEYKVIGNRNEIRTRVVKLALNILRQKMEKR